MTIESATAALEASAAGEVALGFYRVHARTRKRSGDAPYGPWQPTSGGWGSTGNAVLRWNADQTAPEIFLESSRDGVDRYGHSLSKATAVCQLRNTTDSGGEFTSNVHCADYTYRGWNEVYRHEQSFPATPDGLRGEFTGALRGNCMRLLDMSGAVITGAGGWMGGGHGDTAWRKEFQAVMMSRF